MAENKTIYGNINSVKNSILDRMRDFVENVYEPGVFLPAEISEMMIDVTTDINKEVAVFLDRKNRVIAIAVGDDRSVPLPELEGRRSNLRLCGIRCIHTHPNGSVRHSIFKIHALRCYGCNRS